jgi:hypothetical protein
MMPPLPFLALIHRSAWNGHSRKFVFAAFSVVGLLLYGVLRSSSSRKVGGESPGLESLPPFVIVVSWSKM